MRPALLLALLTLAVPALAAAQSPPANKAVYTDPPADKAAPAKMVVVHIPSGGVKINGVVLLAAGAGPHPTAILFHGLPGNEKNLDLAQDLRRAGWTVVTLNYRGSWGSPGVFSFAHVLEDARAAVAQVREPSAATLRIDPAHLVLIGHSMGGWAALRTAARENGLMGVVAISAADMGGQGVRAGTPGERKKLLADMADDMESLAGITPVQMTDSLIANGKAWSLVNAVPGLTHAPLLFVESDDGLAPEDHALAAAIRKAGGRADEVHFATDHSYSDKRIAMASAVIGWLQALPGAPKP